MSETPKPHWLVGMKPLFRNDPDGPRFHDNWSWDKDKGKRTPRKFWLTRCLEKGSFGEVWVLQRNDLRRDKPVEFAAKVVRKHAGHDGVPRSPGTKADVTTSVFMEAKILARLRHKHIVMCYGAFENDDSWLIVLEYAEGGDIFHRLQDMGMFSEAIAAHYVRQMVDAIAYLHSNNIIHRDIKIENFLIKSPWSYSTTYKKDNLLLCDFGYAVYSESGWTWGACGTPEYAAPEVYEGYGLPSSEYYTKTVDIWSLGETAYKILTGSHLIYACAEMCFDTENRDWERAVTNGDIADILEETDISEKGQEFLRFCLNVDPDRLPAKELLNHKWLSSCNDKYLDHEAMKKWKADLIAIRGHNVFAGKLRKMRAASAKGKVNTSSSTSHKGATDQKQYQLPLRDKHTGTKTSQSRGGKKRHSGKPSGTRFEK
ncbi:kinase-like protein [Fomitiporia mediterranea MF3/22]|uniref:kinase-like protein n=1 Tax=Fomitiporia mediterranea (strain MF3/22) TaxID=694068 RepID=UPI0004407A23|nr:kinase-like protein [Fomitiporia mediterranea MF3/22]EJD04687.1 kinase-like protein [Fomitiporia mediterranea MF3/22]